MEVFAADYIKLCDGTKSLGNRCRELEEIIRKIAEDTENLDIFWDGDANGAFVMAINDDLAFIESVLMKIRECIRGLNSVYKEYQENEKVVQRIVEGMKI